MSETHEISGAGPNNGAQNLVLFVLPGSIILLFASVLFYGFTGDQASEIAKLIREIEIGCRAAVLTSFLPLDAATVTAQERATCWDYLPKVVLFYVLVTAWSIIAFVATANLSQSLVSHRARFWWSACVAVSIPLIIMVKFFVAGQHHEYVAFQVSPIFEFKFLELPFFTVVLLGLLLVSIIAIGTLDRMRGRSGYDHSIRGLFWLSIAVWVAASLAFTYYPGNLYDVVGSINIVFLYALLLYVFVTGLFLYGRRTGYPIVGFFLIYFLAINALSTSENDVTVNSEAQRQPWQGNAQFLEWLKNRRDVGAYSAKKYPVYVIASSGGGMYAAMRTAYYLETLQRHCPRFLHHIFAISSVSGGALGALAFAADQQTRPIDWSAKCDFGAGLGPTLRTDRESTLDRFFAGDVVSSIVGGGLFPGMLRRTAPFPVPAALNRASAFRSTLSDNWLRALPQSIRKKQVGRDPCGSPGDYFSSCDLDNYWSPEGNFPFMVFNATWVDAGMPVVLSNLSRQYYNRTRDRGADADAGGLKLIDGASLSARFPIALPAGVIEDGGGYMGSKRLVDGGYFDNSGLNTARAIRNEIGRILKQKQLDDRAEVHLIYLGEDFGNVVEILTYYGELQLEPSGSELVPVTPGWFEDLGRWLPSGSELGAHAKALFRARDQRSQETLKLVRQLAEVEGRTRVAEAGLGADTDARSVISLEWRPVELVKPNDPCQETIPLAWYLAPCTRERLKNKLEASLLEVEANQQLEALQAQLSP